MYDEELFAMPEVVGEDYIIATYYLKSVSTDLLRKAAAIAIEQTTGTWLPVPAETKQVREKHIGKVISVYEIPDYEVVLPKDLEERQYLIQIAYPEVNINRQIPLLLSTVIGNISMMGKLKLLDLSFPKSFIEAFSGPRFGIEGIRKLLNIPKRPLLLNMIKPCTGIPPEKGAELFYQAALGGTDIVKDDELLADAEFSSIEERVRKFMVQEKRVYEETGERTLYTVNITDRTDKIKENAKRAVALGANALMVNYLTVGISCLQSLAEDPEINVPILAHLDFAGVMYESPFSGISSHLVLGKLPRLAGADMILYPNPYAKFEFLREKYLKIALAQRLPLYQVKPAFPAPSGGVYPGMIPRFTEELGFDCILSAGGAIHGHPLNATAGAKAFRQAIDAVMAEKSLKEAAKENKELKIALDTWGILEKERES